MRRFRPALARGHPVRAQGAARGLRYFLQDVAYVLTRLPVAIGRGLRATWRSLSGGTQRRLAAAIAAIAALAAFWLAAVPALPCEFPAGDECPPDDDAIEIVPAEALAYVHLTLDPDSEQYDRAAELAERLPLLSDRFAARLLARLPGPRGAPPDFDRDLDGWFGQQAALAVIPGERAAADEVQLLEADDEDAAREYAEKIAAGSPQSNEYRGVEVSEDERGLATAIVGGFLVIGGGDGVRALVDVSTGASGADSLGDSGAAEEAIEELPAARIAEAYISPEGAEELVTPASAPLASLEPFVSGEATTGAAAALSIEDDGLEVAVRSRLDEDRVKSDPGFFAAFPNFDPGLASELTPEALAYLGFGDPGGTVEDLLAQASAEAPALAAGFGDLADRLRRLGKVDLERDLLPALGDEAAVAIEPKPARATDTSEQPEEDRQTTAPIPSPDESLETPGGDAINPIAQPAIPYLSILADGVEEDRARRALARLQGPIADALDPGVQAPVFDRSQVAGVEAQSLRLSPTVNLSYAVFDSKVVVSTDPAGVVRVATNEDGLDGADRFERATDGFTGDPSMLAYLNLRDLVRLGESQGLADILGGYIEEARLLEALGLAVAGDQDSLSTDVQLALVEDD